MGRRELREQIFLLLFRVEFNDLSDMPEQMQLFLADDEIERKQKDADYIVKEVGDILERTINDAVAAGTYDNMECRAEAREKIARYVMKETGKRPMILPAIVEINVGI